MFHLPYSGHIASTVPINSCGAGTVSRHPPRSPFCAIVVDSSESVWREDTNGIGETESRSHVDSCEDPEARPFHSRSSAKTADEACRSLGPDICYYHYYY